MSSMTTFVAFPTVSGIGRAKVVDDPPAVPESYHGEQTSVGIREANDDVTHVRVVVRVPPDLTVAINRSAAVQADIFPR